MRETRTSGSEGGGAHALPTPIEKIPVASGCKAGHYVLTSIRFVGSIASHATAPTA